MRLTAISKAFIAMVILGVVGYVAWHHQGGHDHGGHATALTAHDHDHDHEHEPAGGDTGRRTKRPLVVGMSELGGAYPGVVANAGLQPGTGSRFSARGLDLRLRMIRDAKERLAAFEHGEIDVLQLPLDTMASLAPGYRDRGQKVQAFFLTDWSRGGLGIVAAPRVKTIEELRGARLATTRNSTAHFFLLMMLRDASLSPADILGIKKSITFATKAQYAAEMFRRGDVDAAVAWEPYLSQAMAGGKGRLLISTEMATNLVAEVLCARAELLHEREGDIIALVRGWLEGVEMVEREPDSTLAELTQATGWPVDETRRLTSTLKPAHFADNREFFGLEHEDALYLDLFTDAGEVWRDEGLFKVPAPAADTRWLHALEAVAGEHAGEKVHETFSFKRAPKKDAAPLLHKTVTIYFESGSAGLDAQDRQIIDKFVEELEEFGNAYVRVEGHTDANGARARNLLLSQQRAQAVVDDLVARHHLDPARFQAVGHGADKPVGSNDTAAGRDLNRRTDFMILRNQ